MSRTSGARLLAARRVVLALPAFAVAGLVLALLLAAPADAPVRAGSDADRLAAHLERLGVARWHAAGQRGRGVKVALLDSDFHGYREQRGRSLPRRVHVKSFREDGDIEASASGHGLRAAQVVHAIAPGAELLLLNWEPSTPERFFDAVRWAIAWGAHVISCSITVSTWGDGQAGGPYHARLLQLLGKGDRADQPLFVCAAGNLARGHWGGASQRGSGGLHEWRPGVVDNPIISEGKGAIRVSLLHPRRVEWEMLVFEGDSSEPLDRKRCDPKAELPAVALTFTPKEGKSYRLRLRLLGDKAGALHCIARPGRLGIRIRRGSICSFPADSPAVLTVGAVDWSGRRAAYSACGPARTAHKPEMVAPVPFPTLRRPEGFHGTSAAAPQVAAVAALRWGQMPRPTPRKVREALIGSLRSLGKGGYSPETGLGRLALPRPEK
jgi:subtilisin family serine protease